MTTHCYNVNPVLISNRRTAVILGWRKRSRNWSSPWMISTMPLARSKLTTCLWIPLSRGEDPRMVEQIFPTSAFRTPDCFKYYNMCFAFRSLETKKKELMALFAEITKDDVTLNNYISRSKILGTPSWDFGQFNPKHNPREVYVYMRGKPKKEAQDRTNQCVLRNLAPGPLYTWENIFLYLWWVQDKHVPLFHSNLSSPLLLEHLGTHLPHLLRNIKAPASSTPAPRTKPAKSSKGKSEKGKEKEGKEKCRSHEDGETKPKKAKKPRKSK